jgi:hypothetical protein
MRPRARVGRARAENYWTISSGPLHSLVLLAPLVVAYEIGSILHLTDPSEGERRSIHAENLLGDFFQLFGLAGLFLPGIALLTVLLVWHILSGARFRVNFSVVIGMAAESAAWTIPLVVLSAVHHSAVTAAVALAAGDGGLGELSWQARLTISIGAGLYEEMLFRLVGITFLHFLLADLLRVNTKAATALAVAGSALGFALYHQAVLTPAGLDAGKLVFFTAAGAYLGAIFVFRGFGVAVATHILYDILVLVLLPTVERAA